MKKVIKENKVLFSLAIIILISFIVMGFSLVSYFYGGKYKDKYGNRLEGIDKVKISSKIDTKINDLLKDNKDFNNVSIDVKGKVIYVNLDVKGAVSKINAQNIGIKALEAFSDKEKEFYDIQFILTNKGLKEESKLFPFMGYKGSESKKIVWTNNGR